MKFEVKIDENEAKIVEATGAYIAAKNELGNSPHTFAGAIVSTKSENGQVRKFKVSDYGNLKMENCQELKP